jgi:hypothetical protein
LLGNKSPQRSCGGKNGNSILVKVGLALIVFPDPTISNVLSEEVVASGRIQKKAKHSALHMKEVYKTFPKVIKELDSLKQNLN